MTMQDIINEIRLELTGYILEMEIDDKTLESIVNKALREIGRFWDETTMITVPYASCIDMSFKDANGKIDESKEQVSSIVGVYRTQNLGNAGEQNSFMDPAFAQQWMMFSSGGTMYNLNDFILNYASWQTVNQIRNTLSTDLS